MSLKLISKLVKCDLLQAQIFIQCLHAFETFTIIGITVVFHHGIGGVFDDLIDKLRVHSHGCQQGDHAVLGLMA